VTEAGTLNDLKNVQVAVISQTTGSDCGVLTDQDGNYPVVGWEGAGIETVTDYEVCSAPPTADGWTPGVVPRMRSGTSTGARTTNRRGGTPELWTW
jgi:hypothetical protein